MKSLIKREGIIRIDVVIAGILLVPIAAVSYQASSIPGSQVLNPNERVKILQSSSVAEKAFFTKARPMVRDPWILDSAEPAPRSRASGWRWVPARTSMPWRA